MLDQTQFMCITEGGRGNKRQTLAIHLNARGFSCFARGHRYGAHCVCTPTSSSTPCSVQSRSDPPGQRILDPERRRPGRQALESMSWHPFHRREHRTNPTNQPTNQPIHARGIDTVEDPSCPLSPNREDRRQAASNAYAGTELRLVIIMIIRKG